jgi:5,10-methylenetetrahydromethanopterin reductase
MLVWGTVVDDAAPDAEYLMATLGAGAGSRYHSIYEFAGSAVDGLPGGRRYRDSIEEYPADRRHLAVWAAHLTGATVEERAVLTPEIASRLTLTGSTAVVRERLAALDESGLTEVVYQPAGPDIERELSAFAASAGLGGQERDT